MGRRLLTMSCTRTVLVILLMNDDQGQKSCEDSDWVKINQHTVCFKGKGNHYGSFYNYVREGLITAIKLEYVSGTIRCLKEVQYDSRWGCNGYSLVKDYPFNVIVTDDNDNVLFPKKKYVKYPAALYYWMPFINPVDADELVFMDYRTPFYFPLEKELRIWYGEDLKNWSEVDNVGRVCVNVYAQFKL
ncbi:uncharacterized protein LOC116303206 [Actinia tenebrosa]|uniref:Uncharacterized protein LOC116303206 n=1 Tax=Actinia tenebrosa TaxID=6105 RepID=A0A6P8IND9_ACTTE|nr:uncharacterized protein LOC116303206 [Actinia tenebrosa]